MYIRADGENKGGRGSTENIIPPVILHPAETNGDMPIQCGYHTRHSRHKAYNPGDDSAPIEATRVPVCAFFRGRVEVTQLDPPTTEQVVIADHDAGQRGQKHGERRHGRHEDGGGIVEEPRLDDPREESTDDRSTTDIDPFREQTGQVHSGRVAV